MSHENILRLWNDASVGGLVRPKLNIINKTADYTVRPIDFGSVFTTRGALAQVTFTLPAASSENKGDWNLFASIADVNMLVEGAAGGLVAFNNLTADNIGFGDASEKIGGMILVVSDGTSWLAMPLATETQTVVVESTSTATATSSGTPSASATSTATGTSSTTPTASGSSTFTSSGTGSSTTTPTGTSTATWSISGSDTASHTQSASSTATGTGTSTPTGTSTVTSTPSKTSSATSTPSGTSTSTSSTSGTSTGTPTGTATP